MSLPINQYVCSKCGYVMNRTTGITGEPVPKEGDFGICWKCGNVVTWLAGLKGVKEISEEEWEAIRRDYPNSWKAIQNAMEYIARRNEAENV